MKIEAGKYYRTRDGRKVGPMVNYEWGDRRDDVAFIENYGDGRFWSTSGIYRKGTNDTCDIIAEWTESPVREVTRKEIVPGVYGQIRVYDETCEPGHVCLGSKSVAYHWTVAELTAAIDTLTQIRDAMQEGGE
jgi:hypothetical protein